MALLDILRKKHGADFHPAMLLADVVAEETNDLKLRVDCAKTLMPYIEASKKAIEVRGEISATVGLLRISMFEPKVINGELEDLEGLGSPLIENITPIAEGS